MTAQEMLEKRRALIAEARRLNDDAEKENRDLNTEETDRFKRIMDDAHDLKKRYTRQEALEAEERGITDPEAQRRAARPKLEAGETPDYEKRAMEKYRPDVARRVLPIMSEEYRTAWDRYLVSGDPHGLFAGGDRELRNLQADDASKGGFAVAPEQFMADLIQAVDDAVYIRQWARTVPVVGAGSLGRPSLDADPADADWTAELGTGNEDSTMAFGKRELVPAPLAKRIKVSKKLLRQAALPVEALVRERLAYKFAVTEEKAFLTGTGANQPLGVMVASADGISTSRDASSGSATSITMNALKAAKYDLKQPYRDRARWLFHRDGISIIASLRSDSGAGAGTGTYLWQESVRLGEPDRLMGIPVFESEYMPNTFTTGLYVGILGDWAAGYMIADSLLFDLQVLTELYAATNENGYIGRAELDGMPVLEEAFVRLKTD